MLDIAVRRRAAETAPARWWARPAGLWATWRVLSFAAFVAVGGKPIVGAARWDDGYYLTIVRQGYRPHPSYGVYQQTNFFPLLSWTTRAVQSVVRSETIAVHLVVSAASLSAVLVLYAITRRQRDEVTALLAAESGRHRLAAVLGIGVAMTRSVGVLIVVPLLLARAQRRQLDRTAWPALLPIVGLFAVMVAQWWQAGDPFAFQKTSALWGRHTTLPISPLVDRLQEILVLRNFNAVTFTDFACVVIVLWLAAYSLRSNLSWCLRAWLIAMALVPLTSGLTHSWSRYMLAAWPAAILAADRLRHRPRSTVVAIFFALALLNVQIVAAWHGGLFIG